MRAWLILFVLACGAKDAPAPGPRTIDRSCTTDADCSVVVVECCPACDPIGDAVNAKAWSRGNSCDKLECPQQMCPKLPACRDESHAVCKQTTCTLERRPNAACAGSAAP